MKAFYNDNDRKVCAWLRELIKQGHITDGVVDDRPIQELNGSDLAGYERVHLFAGIGGWDYALNLAGWSGPVWTGSCPCQPFSVAGKRKGTADERHLWPEMFRLIKERNPPVVFGEQVASKDGLGSLDGVFTDLEGADYACGASDLCAAGVGAPHVRQRLFWCANSDCDVRFRSHAPRGSTAIAKRGFVGESVKERCCRFDQLVSMGITKGPFTYSEARSVVHGIPNAMGRLRGYGNAIVPQVAAEFISAYMEVQS